jgi:phosphate transport system permease protein
MQHRFDLHESLFFACAAISAVIVILIFGFIFWTALPVFQKEGIRFVIGTHWDYSKYQFESLLYIIGTISVTVATLVFAVPLGLLTAVYLAEFAPPPVERILRPLIELLVGIPSIVYGLFGFLFLQYVFKNTINPFIDRTLGFIPIFRNVDPAVGTNILLAAFILTIMVLPTIVALSQDALLAVPRDYREASLALGATRWETVVKVTVPAAWSGIVTSIVLAMMRAMGETMAVVMVLGNQAQVPTSLLSPAYAMTSKILNDIGYYMLDPMGKSALFGLAAVLFAIEIIFVASVRWIMTKGNRFSS